MTQNALFITLAQNFRQGCRAIFKSRLKDPVIIKVSVGEVVDKVAILSIKAGRMGDPNKLVHAQKELDYLKRALRRISFDPDSPEVKALKEVNLKLWGFENAVRAKEKNRQFDDEFVRIACGIYRLNDVRSALKRKIGFKYHSDFIEEKEYLDLRDSGGDHV